MRLLLAALLLFISASASAAGCAGTGNCYWVGGTGNFSDTTHWATTDGGATTGSIPTATDNCNFTANSSTANAAYTATVDASTTCLDFVMAGPGGGNKVTWAGNQTLALSGSMNLSGGTAGITLTYNGSVTFNATASGKTITSNGVTLSSALTFNGVGGAWTLQDALNIVASTLFITAGSLDTNGKTITAATITHSAVTSATLTLGASTANLSGAFCLNWSQAGLTLNAGTSTINCTGSAVAVNLSSGDSYTFNNLSMTPTGISSMTLGANQTVGGTLTLTGAAANTRVGVTSNTVGTARTITAATVSLTDVDFQDITGAGTATWSGTRVGNRLGNSGISFTAAVPKFWVGGTGNWSDATNHWATSSGGGAGVNNYPLPQDNAKFDSASNATAYTVTVNQPANMQDLNFSAAPSGSGTITWAASNGSTIQGNFTALSGMVKSGSGANTFAARSSGKTITSNSLAWASTMSFNGPSGAWTLQDDLNIGTNNLTLTNGTLDANGKTITASTLAHTVSNSTMALTLGSSAINLSGGSCFNWTQTGLTVTPGTSTITCSAATTPLLTSGDSYTFNNLSMTFTASVTNTFTIGANQTVGGTLTLAGASAITHPLVQASVPPSGTAVPGAGPYTITANAVSLTDVDFTDIRGAGAATWTGTRLGDCKGNSGITFTTGAPKYYVGNTNSWNSANVWATASGGAGATNNFPLCQDTANLDAGSFSANGQTLSMTQHRIPGFVAASTDQTYTVSFTAVPSAYGDVTLDANATISGASPLTMVGRNTQTITSVGKTWTAALIINSPGGTIKFADAATFTGGGSSGTTLTRGTLDLNGQVHGTTTLSTSNANSRTIKDGVGGGKIVTSNTGVSSPIAAAITTGLTIDRTNSWTIEIGGNTGTTRSLQLGPIDGSGPAWPTITVTNTTASATLNFTGGGTMKSLVVSHPPQTLNFTAGTVHKIESTNGFPSGTAGNLITVTSATPGSPFTLTQTSGSENVDYVSITDSAATPGSTWCAGVNSTNGGGNTGWTFNSSACAGAAPSTKTGNFLPFLQ